MNLSATVFTIGRNSTGTREESQATTKGFQMTEKFWAGFYRVSLDFVHTEHFYSFLLLLSDIPGIGKSTESRRVKLVTSSKQKFNSITNRIEFNRLIV